MLKNSMQSEQVYRAVWRWHFYAGIFVLPFLLLLSLSGLLMLLSKPIEPLFYKSLLEVKPQGQALPASTLLATVSAQYPHAKVQLYIPARNANESAQFSLSTATEHAHGSHDAPSTTVYIDPYNAQILGTLDPGQSVYTWIKTLHSSLFLGDLGDSLIEIAAGLAVLMILSGLYLAWPRDGWRSLLPRLALVNREDWRRLHRIIGCLISIPLLFLLISGLAWTNVWGGKLVQPWSSLPGTRFEAPQNADKHAAMNIQGQHHVPWALEQTPLPQSSDHSGAVDLDRIVNTALVQGFVYYRIHFPQDDKGVWTVSATTIAGDLSKPFDERILHLDQFSAEVLADLKFADYPAMGQAMAAFIPLHQGDLGWWNWLLNLFIVLLVLVLLTSGLILWWKRRPLKQARLAAPSAHPATSKAIILIMLFVSLCFPLSALALLTMIMLDGLLISRIKRLRIMVK